MSDTGRLSTVIEGFKNLRACLTCKLVKTENQFCMNGCENCQVNIDTDTDLQNYTTNNFAGMISLMDPDNSWVAKWQGLVALYPGVYAIDVKAEV